MSEEKMNIDVIIEIAFALLMILGQFLGLTNLMLANGFLLIWSAMRNMSKEFEDIVRNH